MSLLALAEAFAASRGLRAESGVEIVPEQVQRDAGVSRAIEAGLSARMVLSGAGPPVAGTAGEEPATIEAHGLEGPDPADHDTRAGGAPADECTDW